jgi:hypothetical protein
MGVFAVTAFSSIWAYVWLYLVLRDQMVDSFEAWLTFFFFWALIAFAFGMDRYKASQEKKEGDAETGGVVIEYTAVEVFRELIDDKKGIVPTTEAGLEKRNKMKSFVKETMKTD